MTRGDQVFTGSMVVSDVLAKSAETGKNSALYEKSEPGIATIKRIKATNISVEAVNGVSFNEKKKCIYMYTYA